MKRIGKGEGWYFIHNWGHATYLIIPVKIDRRTNHHVWIDGKQIPYYERTVFPTWKEAKAALLKKLLSEAEQSESGAIFLRDQCAQISAWKEAPGIMETEYRKPTKGQP